MSTHVRTLLAALSFAVAAIAVALWIRMFRVTGSDVEAVLAGLRWWTLPAIFGLLVIHVAMSALRWTRIETALGGNPPPFRRAFLAGALALGLGTFLPGPLANVACRGLSNRFSGESGMRGAIGGGLDQIADLAIVILLAVPAALAFSLRSPAVYVIGALVVSGIGWGISEVLSRGGGTQIASYVSVRWPPIAPFFVRGLLVEIYALTLLRFLNLTAITLLIYVASRSGTFGAVLVSVPLVTLAISVTMLPGAFGSSEWSFTGVLSGFGVSSAEITAFVLTNRLILTSFGLALGFIGALCSLRSSATRSPVSSAP
ncbi:MAG TPA: lysylphosphatidylglycerol synthase domain-containing protein [Sphingomicrobium sp.]|nr:lysylphosphatidylglycerol synthase domain-containing protein [Sphingomicrobium sp.]